MAKLIAPIFLIISIVLIVLLQFGFIFLLLALLPSIVAYYTDAQPRKPSFKIVFMCNFAATLPFLAPMVKTSLKLKHYDVTPILQDPSTWLFVYSGAAAGWCLIFLCRVIARLIVTITYEYQITVLENLQKRLLDEWGQQIKQPPR